MFSSSELKLSLKELNMINVPLGEITGTYSVMLIYFNVIAVLKRKISYFLKCNKIKLLF
jgi:hypothetical protein